MMDRARALRPLEDAAPAMQQLDSYESPAELAGALRATWHAVDTSLRTLVRSDPAAPDELRLHAFSRIDAGHDAVITHLRRQDAISLHLAGRVHELMQAAARAEAGTVRPADADAARMTAELLRRELSAAPPAADRGRAGDELARHPEPSVAVDGGEGDVASSGPRLRHLARRPLLLMAVAVLLIIAFAVAVLLVGRSDDMSDGVEAFRAGRMGVAEQHFRAALQRSDDNVTARLYLARILRAQGRNEEAAQTLRTAAQLAPRDAAVRRELGYLFLDLGRPEQSVQQFRQAVELDPTEPMGWVALHEALTRTGDGAAAAEVLRRAPSSAQAMIRTGR
jgi:tetratricopeptide (TPR) repeat protein